jgi:cation diffusion facilitator CzcD-associated flavoprotein CzcO
MLQRSPTYIASRPSSDSFADWCREAFPEGLAHNLSRWKNILQQILLYQISQRKPEYVRHGILAAAREALGDQFDVEKHFSPTYDPWNQRFCLAPDGDFFRALASGRASIVTDHIDRFTPDGILLKSGDELPADLVVSATGLEMQLFGGAKVRIDNARVDTSQVFTYRGMMLSGIPNLAMAIGYTNASWTLKVDLTAERVCRLLNHLDSHGVDYCVPSPPDDIEAAPLIDFSSGYIQRALPYLPKQGTRPPWRTYQNYIKDMLTIRYGRIRDGHMRFVRLGSDASGAG